MTQDELAHVFAAARGQGVKTVLDVATPGPGDYLPRLEKLLPHVDVFLPNNHEGRADHRRDGSAAAGGGLSHDLGARTVVITMGGDGAVLVQDGLRLQAGVYPVPSWTAAAAATPSTPATSTACCTTSTPKIVCASPAPWGELRAGHRHDAGRVHGGGMFGVYEEV